MLSGPGVDGFALKRNLEPNHHDDSTDRIPILFILFLHARFDSCWCLFMSNAEEKEASDPVRMRFWRCRTALCICRTTSGC